MIFHLIVLAGIVSQVQSAGTKQKCADAAQADYNSIKGTASHSKNFYFAPGDQNDQTAYCSIHFSIKVDSVGDDCKKENGDFMNCVVQSHWKANKKAPYDTDDKK